MKIVVCIGSSCHLKGSRYVVERIQQLIAEGGLEEKVDLGGTFCLGKCQDDVCVTVDGEVFSVTPDNVDEFFKTEVVDKL